MSQPHLYHNKKKRKEKQNKKKHLKYMELAAINDLTQFRKLTIKIVESAWADISFFLYKIDLELT